MKKPLKNKAVKKGKQTNPNSLKNLKPPINKRSTKEAREISKKGGIKSGEVRRTKKTFRQLGQEFLELKAPGKIIKAISEIYPQLKGEDISSKMAAILRLQHKALSGDRLAFETLRDTVGEKPIDKSEVKNKSEGQFENMTKEELHAELARLRAKTGKYRSYRSKNTKPRAEITD